jgi:putative PIN family toxin of toxin-antitoxin system
MVKYIAQHAAIFTAEEILAEAREVSLRPDKQRKYQLTEATIDRAITSIREFVTVVTNLPVINVVRDDPDDNVILACALKAHADYLVSYDPHLTKLKEYQGIKILTPKEFMPFLQQTTG